ERAGGGDDGLLVDLDTGQGGRLGARGDDDGPGRMDLVPDLHLARRGHRSPALQPGYLVLLEEKFDAFGVLGDDVVLVAEHLRPVDLRGGADKAHLLEIVPGLVEHVAGVEERLRRDAADVQAGPAERLAALDAGRLQPQLRAADGADVAAGAGADHDDVKLSHVTLLGIPVSGPRHAGVGFASDIRPDICRDGAGYR